MAFEELSLDLGIPLFPSGDFLSISRERGDEVRNVDE